MNKENSKIPSKWSDLGIRLLSAFLFIIFQIFIMLSSYKGIYIEVLIVQFLAFYEFIRLSYDEKIEKELNFYIKIFPYLILIGFTYYFSFPEIFSFKFLKYHKIISFMIISILLVLYIIFLNPDQLSYCYKKIGYTFLGIFIISIPANIMAKVSKISIFWFFMSISLIILNDSAAYFCGRLFGKTPLIKLSPKKTVEGFVGALIIVPLISFYLPLLFKNFNLFICHKVNSFDFNIQCKIPKEFILKNYLILNLKFQIYPAQIYSFIMSLFASTIAPFGGFLASGLKRSKSIKDFGNIIPGHGGILDRVDCQLVMAFFSYLFLKIILK